MVAVAGPPSWTAPNRVLALQKLALNSSALALQLSPSLCQLHAGRFEQVQPVLGHATSLGAAPLRDFEGRYLKPRQHKANFKCCASSMEPASLLAESKQDYDAALQAVATLIPRRRSAAGTNWLLLMDEYIKVLDLDEPMSRLSVIHVAGTKGKGSTCAFAESILRSCGHYTGLFTSPHLIDIRERFRLGGEEVSKDKFTGHFWWCWNRLQAAASDELPMPSYFNFLTLLGLRIVTQEQVDVALLEVGIGGRYDATNVVKRPAVCVVTPLGYDHTDILGETLTEIAGEKAGIFKPGVPAITAPQPEEAMAALQHRADELQIPLEVVPPLAEPVQLGLAGEHQRTNAALAVAACQKWAQRTGGGSHELPPGGGLPEAYRKGLAAASWPGRGQIWHDGGGHTLWGGGLTFYLDGAHTPESMEVCAKWFGAEVAGEPKQDEDCRQLLLFNCMSDRDSAKLLEPLTEGLSRQGVVLHRALFVPRYSSYTSLPAVAAPSPPPPGDLSWQFSQLQVWDRLRGLRGSHSAESVSTGGAAMAVGLGVEECVTAPLPTSWGLEGGAEGAAAVVPSLPAALEWLRKCAREKPPLRFQVLVTGSLHLVGDMLRLLKQR